jgi:hypothetical protein
MEDKNPKKEMLLLTTQTQSVVGIEINLIIPGSIIHNGRNPIGLKAVPGQNGKIRWMFVHHLRNTELYNKSYVEARHFVNGYAAVYIFGYWQFITPVGTLATRRQFLEVEDVAKNHTVLVRHKYVGKGRWRRFDLTTNTFL